MHSYARVVSTVIVVLSVVVFLHSGGAEAAGPPGLYELSVRVLPGSGSVEGRARVTLPDGRRASLRTDGLDIRTLKINGREYGLGGDALEVLGSGRGERVVEIEYSAVFRPEGAGGGMESRARNAVGASAAVLVNDWYPVFGGLFVYRLTAEMPAEFEAVSESEAETVTAGDGVKTVRFDFPHPLEGITLAAGRYRVREERFQGVSIRTYLFSDDEGLAGLYLENTKRYLRLYESMLGKYPYGRFSIVENRFQTGYSFPTYTLLGSSVIRLPFIPETSLGHEILHQWFGNHVYVDYESGNWSEGLTTYLADHWYRELRGEGAAYRKKIMLDYMNYVSAGDEIPLRDFVTREDLSTRSIGYGKAAMVFHMLRRRLGDEAFFSGLRDFIRAFRYRAASWDDLRDSFSAAAGGLDLEGFFTQWVDGKGVPEFDVRAPEAVYRDGSYLLRLNIVQKGGEFAFDLPARVETEGGGEEEFVIRVDKADVRYERAFPARPLRVFLDEDYDTMRRLAEREVPPVLSAFTGRRDGLVVVPEGDGKTYAAAADFFRQQGYTVRTDREVTDKEIAGSSILIMSVKNRIYRRLFADRPLPDGGFVVKVYKNPLDPQRVAVVFDAEDPEEVQAAFRKVFRYGNYSLLVFEGGRNISRETAGSESGIYIDLRPRLDAVETKSTMGLEDVVRAIRDSRVVFIGEMHTAYEHHVMQYEIIRRLYEYNGGRLVIGMEMFQRPFQEYLDQYVQGGITEAEFLRKTEYFDRWVFDYNLYRDILQFARANRIPVMALNVRKEILKKVSKGGIGSLTEEEYAEIPQDMDMTNLRYREHLRKVFDMHDNNKEKNFDYFVQSQILWDETMAHSIAETLKQYPETQMVVLAGNGHVQYSWGIPDRVRRLTGERPVVVLNYGGEGFDRGIADYVLFPKRIEPPESARLMVSLKKREAGGVVIEKVVKGGPAARAGLRKGDVITAMDGRAVEDVQDVKIALLDIRPGDRVKITVKRKRFVFGWKEKSLYVEF
ncbi:MAG TPA: PDZ domain-containing protein [Nitrospirae bacterium]|nr:PDZ domain-containing protein [Nitrospirota bacterium]